METPISNDLFVKVLDYKEQTKKYVKDNIQELKREQDYQIKEEEQYLQENSNACHFSDIEPFQYNKQELHKLLLTQFYNPQLLEMVSCLVNTIALIPDYDELPGKQLRIRNFITDLRTLASGTFGQTFEASLLHGNKDFVIKVPKKRSEDLVHEYFVGKFVNRLRQVLPNFAYTYAGFTCSPPILTSLANKSGLKTINWCARKPGFQYIIQERIPGLNLTKILAKLNISQFMAILLQVVLSLAEAHKQIKFTHYDLHSGNIILRDLGQLFSLSYPSPTGKLYVNSRYLATIIDYGNAFVSVDINGTKNFGRFFLEEYGVTRRSFPLYDIFTLLADSYYTAPKLRYPIGLMFKFFGIEDASPLAQANPLGQIFLPPIEPWISQSHWDFIGYLRNKLPEFYMGIFSNKPLSQQLNCESFTHCLTDEQLLNVLHLKVSDNIVSVLDYYDLIKLHPEKSNVWKDKFDFEEELIQLDDMYGDNLDLYQNLTRNPPLVVSLENVPFGDLYDFELQHRYFLYLQYLAQITEILDNFELIKNIYQTVYPAKLPKFLTTELDDAVNSQQDKLTNVGHDYNYINNFVNSKEYIQNQDFKRFLQFVKVFHYQI